jgi:hypothetical protein
MAPPKRDGKRGRRTGASEPPTTPTRRRHTAAQTETTGMAVPGPSEIPDALDTRKTGEAAPSPTGTGDPAAEPNRTDLERRTDDLEQQADAAAPAQPPAATEEPSRTPDRSAASPHGGSSSQS